MPHDHAVDTTALLRSVVRRSREYLAQHLQLDTTLTPPERHGDPVLTLHGHSALISLGGRVNMVVIASFDPPLARHVLQVELGEVPTDPHELAESLGEAAAETANVILGHCTADLATDDATVTLSPPLVAVDSQRFRRPGDSVHLSVAVDTPLGAMRLAFIGPTSTLALVALAD